MDHALTSLQTEGEDVALTYIHLAELGVMKRRDGDISQPPSQEEESPAALESIPHALAQTDAALAQFVARYADDVQSPATAAKWDDTYVMIVGTHGYETSTPEKRLPDPAGGSRPGGLRRGRRAARVHALRLDGDDQCDVGRAERACRRSSIDGRRRSRTAATSRLLVPRRRLPLRTASARSCT